MQAAGEGPHSKPRDGSKAIGRASSEIAVAEDAASTISSASRFVASHMIAHSAALSVLTKTKRSPLVKFVFLQKHLHRQRIDPNTGRNIMFEQ